MSWADGLRALGRQPQWRRWTLASFLARLPGTMMLLALILAGQEATGSLAVGAWLAGTATFTAGAAAQWRGRRLDRAELRSGLERACLATATVFAAEAVAVGMGAPIVLLFVLAVAQGIAMAAITGGFRALLVPVVPPDDLPRANVIEAVFVEVAFVAGPALAGLLALVVGPVGVLAAMAVSSGVAAVVTRGLPTLHAPVERAPFAPWRTAGARAIYPLALALGICVGLLESALPARMEALGFQAAWAGFFLTLLSAGSGVGGLAASAQRDALGDTSRRAVWLLSALGVLLLPLAFLPSLLALALVMFLAGLPIAPLNALGSLLLQGHVPPGRQAEGFAVYVACILIGAGIGQALTGQFLANVGAGPALMLAGAMPLIAAIGVLVTRQAGGRRAGARVTQSR